MKLIDGSGQGFKPFDMTLRFETEAEARLMWHVFNRLNLWDAILDGSYSGNHYIEPDNNFSLDCSEEIKSLIASHVPITGK